MTARSINSLVREAYRNRYAFDRVTVSDAGNIQGHWENTRQPLDPVELGHIDDCRTTRTDTGTRLYNRHLLVFTFAPGA